MNMKFFIIALCFPVLEWPQEFELPIPSIDEFKKLKKENNKTDVVVYPYLSNYIKDVSGKFNIKNYAYPDYDICAFTQKFENDITYQVEYCKEAGGVSEKLVLPKTSKENLKRWVEFIYETTSMEVLNSWNNDQSIFKPQDDGAGCYFKIFEEVNHTTVDIYCGC